MAISGEMMWDKEKYKVDVSASLTAGTTDWAARAAWRWHELLGIDEDVLTPVFATLTQAQNQQLLTPGYYPKLSGDAKTGFTVAIMADGKFPNIINYQGKLRSPDGQLGLPETNEFAGGNAGAVVPITDPAI